MLNRENESDFPTKRSHPPSVLASLNFHLTVCTVVLVLAWQLGGAVAQRYYRRHHLLFDCRRIHPQYCCSPRVRYNCPELCAGHTCRGGSAQQQRQLPPAAQQQRSFGGGEPPSGWPPPPPLSSQPSPIGNFLPPPPPRPSVRPPSGLILPPPDVPPAIVDSNGGGIDSGGQVPLLPVIDSTSVAVVNSAVGKHTEETVTPFPTLIPWNVVSAIAAGSTENSAVSPGLATTRPQGPYPPAIAPPNQGSIDGEIRVGGSSASHIDRPNGVLSPPNLRGDGSSPLSPEEAGTLEELEHFANKSPATNGEEGGELIGTESNSGVVPPPIDNVPPTPVHPETTWVPLSINVRPSAARTTASESSTFTTTTVITPISTAPSPTDQLSISFGNGNTPESGLVEVAPSEKSVETARLSSMAATSFGRFSLTRRGDLPLTPSGDGANGAEPFDKMVIVGGGKITPIINVVPTTKNPATTQGSMNSNCTGIFCDKFDAIVDHVFSQKTIDAITAAANGAGLVRRPSKTRTSAASSTAPSPALPASISTTTTTISTLLGSEFRKCGVAPDFTPCVPLEHANQKLMACCQQRLPPGCLDLCRYNVTQAEIKRQFDAGKCGILSVAPYLECASQAQDNLSCCRHRGVAAKSGPHCEVFCHPSKGLGILGLQHLSCQAVIGDLIHCHYAGLPPLKTDL